MAAQLKPITIAGGGLAGLALGCALRDRDVPVVLHEAGTYPRHRVCGEFISGLDGQTKRTLDLHGILQDAVAHRAMRWLLRDETLLVRNLPEPALGISRHVLDDRLQHRFCELGGTLHVRSRLPWPKQETQGLVWAAGRRAKTKSPWIGFKAHFLGDLGLTGLEMHLGRELYAGAVPVGEGRVNVCALLRASAAGLASPGHRGVDLFLETLRERGLHGLAERLGSARRDEVSFSAVSAMGFGLLAPASRRVCRIGDAFSLIPPFTGNGMTLAFQSAATVLPILETYAAGEMPWREAVRKADAALRRRFARRLRVSRILHPFFTSTWGQRALATGSRTGALPFSTLYRLVR